LVQPGLPRQCLQRRRLINPLNEEGSNEIINKKAAHKQPPNLRLPQ